ncbi:MAG: hypothetical protein M3Q22_05200, partial [Actinomycetota bacterium]|nr:hypothetical protein [Actinomycetota bacterium]
GRPETQHERLRAERCELAQGYLYAAPLDADEAELQILALVAAPAAGTLSAVGRPRTAAVMLGR